MCNLSDYPKSLASTDKTSYGTFKNETQPGARDGTNIQAEQLQDLYYALYQVLGLAGQVPNGELEDSQTQKQFLNSLVQVSWLKYDSQLSYQKNAVVLQTLNYVTIAYRSVVDHNILTLDNPQGWQALFTIDAQHGLQIKGQEATSSTLPIGSIVTMTRQDVPEGYVRCDGAIYPVAAYPSFVNDYLVNDKIPHISMDAYADELIVNHGACG